MKEKLVRLSIALGIASAIILFVCGINYVIDSLTKWTGVDLTIIIAPILFAWLVWLIYDTFLND